MVETLAESGAEILVSPNGSPFDWPKPDMRMNVAVARVTESGLPLVYLNQVGGQDELVFDGASFVLNADRSLAVQMPAWEEAVVSAHGKARRQAGCANRRRAKIAETKPPPIGCMLGLRDYVAKNGFPGVVLGLSGGIDSALVAALAVDALGPDKVHASCCPRSSPPTTASQTPRHARRRWASRTTRSRSSRRSRRLTWSFKDLFAGTQPGITEENLQSRVRGTILMASRTSSAAWW